MPLNSPFDIPNFACKTADGTELNDQDKELIAAHLQALAITLDHLNVKILEVPASRGGKIGARVERLGR